MHTKTKTIEERACIYLLAMVVLTAGVYVYFTISAVLHTVMREEIEISIQKTHAELSALETGYLSKKAEINETYAQTLGFVTLSEKRYANDPTRLTQKTIELFSQ